MLIASLKKRGTAVAHPVFSVIIRLFVGVLFAALPAACVAVSGAEAQQKAVSKIEKALKVLKPEVAGHGKGQVGHEQGHVGQHGEKNAVGHQAAHHDREQGGHRGNHAGGRHPWQGFKHEERWQDARGGWHLGKKKEHKRHPRRRRRRRRHGHRRQVGRKVTARDRRNAIVSGAMGRYMQSPKKHKAKSKRFGPHGQNKQQGEHHKNKHKNKNKQHQQEVNEPTSGSATTRAESGAEVKKVDQAAPAEEIKPSDIASKKDVVRDAAPAASHGAAKRRRQPREAAGSSSDAASSNARKASVDESDAEAPSRGVVKSSRQRGAGRRGTGGDSNSVTVG